MRKLAALAAVTLCAGMMAQAQMTKWSGGYTSVTSATVTYATHGIASGMIGVVAKSGGVRLTLDQVSWTVDQTTYEVDLSFTSSFTGTVYLSGPWPSSDTSNSTDFETTIGAVDDTRLNICAQCATYTARRTYNSQVNTAAGVVSLIMGSGFAATEVFTYIRENQPVYGLNSSTCSASTYTLVGSPAVECNVAAMPAGVTPLAHAYVAGGIFTAVSEDRPW
jgi:hypothetical protein